MAAYYNEIDEYAAQWLRNLIGGGRIAPGDVDTRSIADVHADDLKGYTQCHFFAGIGGWSLALRRAGWDDSRPVWTGSCPCQPFSAAGKGRAFQDERHLWPAWFSLIAERKPVVVFGEQVAAAIGWGWLDAVLDDMEAQGYACGAAVLPACGVGAPHIRQRVYFVGDAIKPGLEGFARHGDHGREPGRVGAHAPRSAAETGVAGFWADATWIPCLDGKARPVEPGIFPLAHGVPARVGRLRAAGNAIVPQAAEAFIRAYDTGETP